MKISISLPLFQAMPFPSTPSGTTQTNRKEGCSRQGRRKTRWTVAKHTNLDGVFLDGPTSRSHANPPRKDAKEDARHISFRTTFFHAKRNDARPHGCACAAWERFRMSESRCSESCDIRGRRGKTVRRAWEILLFLVLKLSYLILLYTVNRKIMLLAKISVNMLCGKRIR